MLGGTEQWRPDSVATRVLNKLSGPRLLAFLTALIVGVLGHLTLMILTPVSADPVLKLNWWQNGAYELYSQGRWAANLMPFLRGYVVAPDVNIMISIVFMSMTAALVVDLFQVQRKLTTVILAASMVVSPVLASHLLEYAVTGVPGWLLPTIAICLVRYRKKTLSKVVTIAAASLLVMISTAIYQANITAATVLPVLLLLLDLLRGRPRKEAWSLFVQGALASIVGAALYYGAWKYFLDVNHIVVLYGGAQSYGLVNTIKKLPTSIVGIYAAFWQYFFGNAIIFNSYWHRGLFYGTLLSSVGITMVLVTYRRLKEKALLARDVLYMALLLAMLPLATISISLFTTDYTFYIVMAVGFVFLIPFMCAVYEAGSGGKMQMVVDWAIVLSAIAVLWTYGLSDNAGYLLVNQTSMQTKELASRVLERIESSPEYRSSMSVAFIGTLADKSYALSTPLYAASPGSIFAQVGVWPGVWQTSDGWGRYIREFDGVQLNYYTNGDQDKIAAIASTPQFQRMPDYPAEGSVGAISGTMVVKFGSYQGQ